jgi:hypothetical protein
LGAAFGVLDATLLCLSLFFLWPEYGIFLGAALTIAIASGITAYLAQNETIPAIIWNLGLAALAIGSVFFLIEWYQVSVHP